MLRNDPPPLATWILEHCVPPRRDEALAGDLMEDFRAGRSDAWYWRQALAACGSSWWKYFEDRGAMLLFAVLWSTTAPGWTAILDRAVNQTRISGSVLGMDWPFAELTTFAVWFLLNLVFFWAGITVFLACHPGFRMRQGWKALKRAMGVPVVVFLPVYFFTFVCLNLFAFHESLVERRTLTLLGGILDVRMWALALRLPYLLTLVCALWRVNPVLRTPRLRAAALGGHVAGPAESFPAVSQVEVFSARRFFALVVAAGIINCPPFALAV